MMEARLGYADGVAPWVKVETYGRLGEAPLPGRGRSPSGPFSLTQGRGASRRRFSPSLCPQISSTEPAVRPVLRVCHQFSAHWIGQDIVRFLARAFVVSALAFFCFRFLPQRKPAKS